MMRVRNEARWIRRSLERTFKVAKTVIVWDDGSTDLTESECVRALGGDTIGIKRDHGMVERFIGPNGVLLYLRSPFRTAGPPMREKEAVNEIRDKNFLWCYCKAQVDFDFMLCLDGDEMLSLEAIQKFPAAIGYLERTADILTLPFIYLWDSEILRRIDGIYGDLGDGYPRLRFPRLFTIKRLGEQNLFDCHFSWQGTKGGFHCGSIPQEKFIHEDGDHFIGAFANLPVVHFGYMHEEERQRKFEFYNAIDPGNTFEGEYKHIIGLPDQHAPGPVERVPWEDK